MTKEDREFLNQIMDYANEVMGDVDPEKVRISEQLEKLTVPQGLTCIWQIEGRDNPDFEYQIKLDKEYIKRKGYLFDIKLILLTIPSVINGKTAC